MQKRRLGISLYPERSTFEQDVAYMEKRRVKAAF